MNNIKIRYRSGLEAYYEGDGSITIAFGNNFGSCTINNAANDIYSAIHHFRLVVYRDAIGMRILDIVNKIVLKIVKPLAGLAPIKRRQRAQRTLHAVGQGDQCGH
jgi:hypothetical protein